LTGIPGIVEPFTKRPILERLKLKGFAEQIKFEMKFEGCCCDSLEIIV